MGFMQGELQIKCTTFLGLFFAKENACNILKHVNVVYLLILTF